jgi:hypothetical protein
VINEEQRDSSFSNLAVKVGQDAARESIRVSCLAVGAEGLNLGECFNNRILSNIPMPVALGLLLKVWSIQRNMQKT